MPPSSEFAPTRLDEVEIGAPLPSLGPGKAEAGVPYRTSRCLVRLHGSPLGTLDLELPPGGIAPSELAEIIQAELGEAIDRHLRKDGIEPAGLQAEGIHSPGQPECLQRLEAFLADAPTVSLVIPTRNRPESALETLRSALRARYPADRLEVIVVDNGSGADRRFELPDKEASGEVPVRVLHEEAPGGSNARNAGLRAARGEIVAFADDDVLVDPLWLAMLARPFGEDERVGGVAGLTLALQLETLAQAWYEGFSSADRGYERRVLDRRDPPADRPLFPFTIGDLGSGENFAFRRQVLLELGGFDIALGTATPALGGEDIEAMLRVLLSNRQVVYEPAAIARHAHPRELDQFERRVWGYGVGLTVCLTKALVENPGLLPALVRKLPGGLAYALSSRSPKNVGKPPDFPSRLSRLELRGMAYGPVAYARSHRSARRRRRRDRGGKPALESKPLRALIVTDYYRPLLGGSIRSLELLSRHLTLQGHTVAIATSWQPGAPPFEEDGGVPVYRVRDLSSRMRWISEDPYKHNPPPFADPEGAWRLRRVVKDFKPDIVHAYGWISHSVAVALTGLDVPLLLSGRDYGNICAVGNLVRKGELCSGPQPAKCLDCARERYGTPKGLAAVAGVFTAGPILRRKVTAVHAVSRYVARVLDRFLHVPGAPATVIPNFHEDEPDVLPDADVMKQLPDRPFILYVGGFRKIKGIYELLEAYESLVEPPPLVMVGMMTPDSPEHFPPGVTVIKDVPHATVMAIWERALFGVLPTKAPEALGNVVHEAMSKGRAMIGTRPGGQEDMIEDGETGLLVPGGDASALAIAMSRLIEDRALRERIEEKARVRARAFTPEVVMPQIESLYYETVQSAHGGRP